MFPYETERHAKAIFSKWLVVATSAAGYPPSEAETNVFARAAVRLAEDFSRVAARYAEATRTKDSRNATGRVRRMISFEELVDAWQRHALVWRSREDRERLLNRFRRYMFPVLASRPAADITTPELIPLFQAIEDAGHLPLAHLILRETIRVFSFGIASGYVIHNPALDVHGALYRWKPRRRPTILLPARIGELLRAIDSYHSISTAGYLIRILPFVFVRPGELRQAEWDELDFKNSLWRIPARRMKSRRPHIVPLSKQAKRLFRQVYRVSGQGRYVFPSSRTADGIISNKTCASMIQSLGFGGEIGLSGFRSMAATLLSEQGWHTDAIERQLAHLDPRPIRRAYNFAEYLPERQRMMQAWGDYLDKLAGRPSKCSSKR